MKVRDKAFSNYLLKEVEDITTSIENACGLNRVHWFAKNSRQRECVVCRAIFSKMMRDKTNISLTEIGSLLDRDHTTVLYSIRNLEMWAEMKGFYKDEAEMLTKSEINYESIHNQESDSYVDMNGNTWIKKQNA